MKNFNKTIFAALLMATALSSCGNNSEAPAKIPTTKEVPTKQQSITETTTVSETTKATTSTSVETTTVETTTTISIEDRKPKVNDFSKVILDEGVEFSYDYCFVPREATDLSDDINLGLLTVDGKEFDINSLADAYGEDEIKSVFNEQAGLKTKKQLIKDKIFDDVYIASQGNPFFKNFIFGENMGVEEIEVNQEAYGLDKSKGAYDFITVEYVNGWFRGLHSKCLAMNAPPTVEQITVNGEEKPFVEVKIGDPRPQFTSNEDKFITYTDKNIAVGGGTTFGDLTAIFGAEPTDVDVDLGAGQIFTYRNSTVTVGFVRGYPDLKPELNGKKFEELSEEEINSLPIVAVYQWLNN